MTIERLKFGVTNFETSKYEIPILLEDTSLEMENASSRFRGSGERRLSSSIFEDKENCVKILHSDVKCESPRYFFDPYNAKTQMRSDPQDRLVLINDLSEYLDLYSCHYNASSLVFPHLRIERDNFAGICDYLLNVV